VCNAIEIALSPRIFWWRQLHGGNLAMNEVLMQAFLTGDAQPAQLRPGVQPAIAGSANDDRRGRAFHCTVSRCVWRDSRGD
jgi:hypothetical protein